MNIKNIVRKVKKTFGSELTFEDKLYLLLSDLTREEAEIKIKEIKKQIDETSFTDKTIVLGIDISDYIDEAKRELAYEIIDDVFVDLFGTVFEKNELKEKRIKEQKELEAQKRIDEMQMQKVREEMDFESKMHNKRKIAWELQQEGCFDKAQEIYEEITSFNTYASTIALGNLAEIYHRNRDFEKERNTLKLYISKSENVPPTIRSNLENVEYFLENGEWKEDCLPSDPKKFYDKTRNAKKFIKEGNKQLGIKMLEKLIRDGSYNNTVYYTLYQIYKKEKRFDDCVRISNKAIEMLGFFSKDRKERWTTLLEKVN
jgi:tetratricopeptide (TPR) repeat protein